MDLDSLSSKHSNELEQQITQLLKTMRTAKLSEHPIYKSLQAFEQELGDVRRKRFDNTRSEYGDY